MNAIEMRHVSFAYGSAKNGPTAKKALDDISLAVESGGITGLIGHTGSGKSTLVQMINGLLKPDEGEVLLDGVNIWAEPKKIRQFRFKAGLVMQYPEYQLFAETVAEDIAFGPKNMGLEKDELDRRVREAARFAGLADDLLQKSPFDLSGGEKRRAAIAGVIAMDPDILILDEPCAGLDPLGRDVLLTQIYRYHKQRNNTVILVSHSMEDVATVCDKVMVMNRSHLEMFDTTQQVFSQGERLASMSLRVPQITSIVDTLISSGIPLDKGTLTVEKAVEDITEYMKREGRL